MSVDISYKVYDDVLKIAQQLNRSVAIKRNGAITKMMIL